jgi:hypothetical protein
MRKAGINSISRAYAWKEAQMMDASLVTGLTRLAGLYLAALGFVKPSDEGS